MTNLEKTYLRFLVLKGYKIAYIEKCGYKRSTILKYQKALL